MLLSLYLLCDLIFLRTKRITSAALTPNTAAAFMASSCRWRAILSEVQFMQKDAAHPLSPLVAWKIDYSKPARVVKGRCRRHLPITYTTRIPYERLYQSLMLKCDSVINTNHGCQQPNSATSARFNVIRVCWNHHHRLALPFREVERNCVSCHWCED